MNKKMMILAIVAAIVSAGCGSKSAANEKNFGQAVEKYLTAKGALCLPFDRWPVDLDWFDLNAPETFGPGRVTQLNALAAIGMASAADLEIESRDGLSGGTRSVKIRRYSLTPAGKQSYREREEAELFGPGKVIRGNICYGDMALDEVVKWEGPMKFGDYQEAQVVYLYKIAGLRDWAMKPEMQAAFPEMKAMIDGAGKQQKSHGVKLTSEGWEPKGLDVDGYLR